MYFKLCEIIPLRKEQKLTNPALLCARMRVCVCVVTGLVSHGTFFDLSTRALAPLKSSIRMWQAFDRKVLACLTFSILDWNLKTLLAYKQPCGWFTQVIFCSSCFIFPWLIYSQGGCWREYPAISAPSNFCPYPGPKPLSAQQPLQLKLEIWSLTVK